MNIRGAISVCVVLALARHCSAQDERSSHIRVPRNSDSDPARLFQDRLRDSKLRADLDAIAKQIGPNGALKDPNQVLKLLESNPQLQELVRGLSANNPQSREQLRSLLGDAVPNSARTRAQSLQAFERELRKLSANRSPAGGGSQTTPSAPGESNGSTKQPSDSPVGKAPVDEADQKSRRQWANNIAEWAEKLPRESWGGLGNSPAVQDMFRQLSESALKAMGGDGDSSLPAQLARWESRLDAVRDSLPSGMLDSFRPTRKWDFSGLPRPDLPAFDMPQPSLPSASGVRVSGAELGAIGNALLGVLALAIVAAVIWKVRKYGFSAKAQTHKALGPWPLDPGSVATREELIRAFEYLTLLRCGESARSWHHHAIADRLGGSNAQRLAEMYEHARYTPAISGDRDWTEAREPLTSLAGAR